MKVILNFAQELAAQKVKETYGDNFSVKGQTIFKTYKTYPYPIQKGYWFIRDNDLYLVVNDDE